MLFYYTQGVASQAVDTRSSGWLSQSRDAVRGLAQEPERRYSVESSICSIHVGNLSCYSAACVGQPILHITAYNLPISCICVLVH